MQHPELSYPHHLRRLTLRLLEGETPANLGLKGWQIDDHSIVIGQGDQCYIDAVRRLKSGQVHANARIEVVGTIDKGEIISLKFAGSTSQCEILELIQHPTRSVMVYGTVEGHVEKGEEAFEISLDDNDQVHGRIVAFSQPARWWAWLGNWAVRPTQLWITQRYLEGMIPPGNEEQKASS
ncbi:DUF1990 family protein [Corynebacterium callunae]|uniref:DUF1990 domain-containing protein n=1 Tax=Corynebacterium callunae TaxID=1721 RepID=UPI003982D593